MKKLQLHIIFLTALLMSSTCHADPVRSRIERLQDAINGINPTNDSSNPANDTSNTPQNINVLPEPVTNNPNVNNSQTTSTEISPVKKPSIKSVSELNAELNSALKKYPSATQLINSIKKSINKSALSYAQLATTADKKIAIHEGFEKGIYAVFVGSELTLSDLRSLGPKCRAVDIFRKFQDMEPPFIPHLIRAYNTSDVETAFTSATKSWVSGKSDTEIFKMTLALGAHGDSIKKGDGFCESRINK